jgi:ABC-type nitrate/sulfonate/bicarbonate transport system permease component
MRAGRISDQALPRAVRVLSAAVGLAVWEWAGRRAEGSLTLSPASAVAEALVHRLLDPRFWTAALITIQALAAGFALIVIVGIPVGLVLGRLPSMQRLAEPHLQFLLVVPAAPLVPLFMIVFGAGLTARIATVFVFGVAMLIVNTAAGVRLVPLPLIRMAEAFGAAPVQIFRRVILPGALPGIMAGLRLASGRAVVGTVVSELIIISVGLGRMINQYSVTFDTANLFAVVITVLAIGVAMSATMARLERTVVRWR